MELNKKRLCEDLTDIEDERASHMFFLFVCRRDSSMVKEEIKAFLGNRRISQAVVAQVTGEWTCAQDCKA